MLSNETIDIPCDCGKETPKKISWLKINKKFTCSCGTEITINSKELLSEITKVEKQLKNLV